MAWGALAVPLLAAAPAYARVDDGEMPPHNSAWPTVLILVLAPLGAFVVIALLTYAPSMLRRPRYRPSRVWDYQAMWFNGPDNPEKAVASTTAIQLKGGGASASW